MAMLSRCGHLGRTREIRRVSSAKCETATQKNIQKKATPMIKITRSKPTSSSARLPGSLLACAIAACAAITPLASAQTVAKTLTVAPYPNPLKFLVTNPAVWNPKNSPTKVPVVIHFHGTFSNYNAAAEATRLAAYGATNTQEKFLAVFPQANFKAGLGGFAWWQFETDGWNYLKTTVNVALVNALLNELVANYNVDPKRIYMSGFSGGANHIQLQAKFNAAGNGHKVRALVLIESTPGDDFSLGSPTTPGSVIPAFIIQELNNDGFAVIHRWMEQFGLHPDDPAPTVDDSTFIFKSTGFAGNMQGWAIQDLGHRYPGNFNYIIVKNNGVDLAKEMWNFLRVR